jgi:hypothetical protein
MQSYGCDCKRNPVAVSASFGTPRASAVRKRGLNATSVGLFYTAKGGEETKEGKKKVCATLELRNLEE